LGKNNVYRQSGVIAYRVEDGRVEVLLVTSRSSKRWVIPKGLVEPHLSPRRSAAKEAMEEAGIKGDVSRHSVGSYEYDKWSGTCHVEVFEMHVERELKRWPEDWRTRKWFSVPKAVKKVDEKKLKRLIREAGKRVATSIGRDGKPK
jgi:8-oxo-dGTP pyrophosphatase MutT (NUDIX family)